MKIIIRRVFSAYFLSLLFFRYFFSYNKFPLAVFYSVDDFLSIVRSQQVVSELGLIHLWYNIVEELTLSKVKLNSSSG